MTSPEPKPEVVDSVVAPHDPVGQGTVAPRRHALRAALGALADFAAVYLGGGLLAGAVWIALVAAGRVPEPGDDIDPGIIGATLLAGFLIALVLGAARLRRGHDSLARDWQRLRERAGIGWLLAVAALTTLTNHVIGLAGSSAGLDFEHAVNQQAVATFAQSVPAPLALLALGIVLPFFEELVFRRLMYQRLLDANAPRIGALAVSVAFVAMHSPLDAPASLALFLCAVYGLLSLLLCWVYARTRSLLAAFVVHASNNLAAVAFLLAA